MNPAHVIVTIRRTVFSDGGAYDDYMAQHPHGSTSGTVTDDFDPAAAALRLLYPEHGHREHARILDHTIVVAPPTAVPQMPSVKSFAAEAHHFTITPPGATR